MRFIDHYSNAIHCLNFNDDCSKLALSRDDGSIEVWSAEYRVYIKELWIPGRANTSIEALQWCGDKLFTGCLSGTGPYPASQ